MELSVGVKPRRIGDGKSACFFFQPVNNCDQIAASDAQTAALSSLSLSQAKPSDQIATFSLGC